MLARPRNSALLKSSAEWFRAGKPRRASAPAAAAPAQGMPPAAFERIALSSYVRFVEVSFCSDGSLRGYSGDEQARTRRRLLALACHAEQRGAIAFAGHHSSALHKMLVHGLGANALSAFSLLLDAFWQILVSSASKRSRPSKTSWGQGSVCLTRFKIQLGAEGRAHLLAVTPEDPGVCTWRSC